MGINMLHIVPPSPRLPSMDLDGPKKSEPVSMNVGVDDGVVLGRDTDSPCPPGAWRSSHLPLPPTGYEPPPGLDDPLPFTMLFSSSTEEVGDVDWHRGQEQHSHFSLKPSAPERKRKHDDDDDDDTRPTADGSSARRIRPRLRTHDGEFSPLLIIPPEQARHPSAEDLEETLSAAHATRAFHVLDHHHGPRVLPRDASPERRRSDSASSLAEVALAKPGRLSTLQDIWLPLPFEDVPGGIVVHERGLDAGPVFLPTKVGRSGGSLVPHASLAGSAMPVLAPGLTKYFDKPLCESPDSISPVEDSGSPC